MDYTAATILDCAVSYAEQWEAEHALREMRTAEPLEPVAKFFQPFLEEAAKKEKTSSLPDALDTNVLDIGCGQGTNTLWLATKGFRVFGFDSSPSALLRLIAGYRQARMLALPSVVVADITKPWPCFASRFDIVIDIRVIENLNEEEALFAYRQVGRALKRGGCFFCLTASEKRSQRYTTVGKVRQIGDLQLAEWLLSCGLEVMSMSREYEGTLEDWAVVARKV